jgi:hypothetical protein
LGFGERRFYCRWKEMRVAARSEDQMARLRRLCDAAGLLDVKESTSYGNPALKARDKTFTALKTSTSLVHFCPLEQKDFLLEFAPEIYWQTDHYKGWPALLVRLDVISDEELQGRLTEAWRLKAPKTLVKAYDAAR